MPALPDRGCIRADAATALSTKIPCAHDLRAWHAPVAVDGKSPENPIVDLSEPVSTIMSTPVFSVQLDDRLSDARHLVCEHGLHHIPVIEADRLVGLLSVTDLIALGFAHDATRVGPLEAFLDSHHSIESLMVKEPVCIGHTQPISKAAAILRTGKYHGLPVVDDEHRVLGIVTSTDMIGLLCDMAGVAK